MLSEIFGNIKAVINLLKLKLKLKEIFIAVLSPCFEGFFSLRIFFCNLGLKFDLS